MNAKRSSKMEYDKLRTVWNWTIKWSYVESHLGAQHRQNMFMNKIKKENSRNCQTIDEENSFHVSAVCNVNLLFPPFSISFTEFNPPKHVASHYVS